MVQLGEKWFSFSQKRTDFKTEIIAGISTYLCTMYILVANAKILSQIGIPAATLITLSALVAGISTLLMAILANSPIVIAPTMGINVFLVFTLIQTQKIPPRTAFGIILVAGILYLFFTLVGIRAHLLRSVPHCLRRGLIVGFGLTLSFMGIKYIGLISNQGSMFAGLSSLTPRVLLGGLGLLAVILLKMKGFKSAFIVVIPIITAIGLLGGIVTPPPHWFSLPSFEKAMFWQFDFSDLLHLSIVGPLITILFIDLFDSFGSVLAMAKDARLIDRQGHLVGLGPLMMISAFATILGAMVGISPSSPSIESQSGILTGGRTGLTSLIVALLFLVSPFFTPLIAMVPIFAIAPVLIIVGIEMIRNIREVDFAELDDAVPTFLCMIIMPLTYSVANGIIIGFISYTLIKVLLKKFHELNWTIYVISLLSLLYLVSP